MISFKIFCFALLLTVAFTSDLGKDCGANIDDISTSLNNAMDPSEDGEFRKVVKAFAQDGSNFNPFVGFTTAPCTIPTGQSTMKKAYVMKWAPDADYSAIFTLTEAFSPTYIHYNTRMTIYSQAPDSPDCDEGGYSWSCETRVADMCQNYPNKPPIHSFKVGREYIILLESQNITAHNFTINIKRIEVNFLETFESTNSGSIPTGWATQTTAAATWIVGKPVELNGILDVSGINSVAIGGVGNKILGLNPFKNGPTNPGDCANDNYASCNHTYDIIETKTIDLSQFNSGELSYEAYFFDGVAGTETIPKVFAKIEGSIDNGVTWTSVGTQDSFQPSIWLSNSFNIDDLFGHSQVKVRFHYGTITVAPTLGWFINNVQIAPSLDFDMCEDGFECTYHTCSTVGTANFGCQHHANDTFCDGLSADCLDNVCNPSNIAERDNTTGCVFTPIADYCNDNLACTLDECIIEQGGCVNTERPLMCKDGRGCTEDFCFNDENPLRTDARDPDTGCEFIPQCDDKVFCTDDTCQNVTTGGDKCLHTVNFNLCEDFIDCTYELTCDAESIGFDHKAGCIRIPMHEWCDDNDACTVDICEASINQTDSCMHVNVTCDDCLACTNDYCDNGDCIHDPVDDMCHDSYDCTVDICDPSLGKCTNTPNDTYCEYFGESCHTHFCRPWASSDLSGCVSIEIECDDQIACTDDVCDKITGECVSTANNTHCIDTLECTDDTCDINLGKCVNIPNSDNCDDGNNCTIDYCDLNGMCATMDIVCTDDIHCTDDFCDPQDGICKNIANNTYCDDGFDCTTDDWCDVERGHCINTPNDKYCEENQSPDFIQFCNILSSTDTTGCYGIPRNCDDQIACTWDYPDGNGGCLHTPRHFMCEDNHDCTDDVCDEGLGRCTNFANNTACDDNDLCSVDTCGCDGECHYEEIVCNDQISCTDDWCNSDTGKCVHKANDTLCDDDIDCTFDYCDESLGKCQNIPYDSLCETFSDCETVVCSAEAGVGSGCVYTQHDELCDDLIGCTKDTCGLHAAGCGHVERNSLCDDGIGCSENICDMGQGGCVYLPHGEWCEDGIDCTSDLCSLDFDCVNTVDDNACNDGINCTRDYCSATQDCQFEPVHNWCSDSIGCTVDTCVPENGNENACVNDPQESLCEDGFECSTHECTLGVGCVTNTTECPWDNLGYNDQTCLNCMSHSSQINQLNYKDGTGAVEFKTRNPLTNELSSNMVLLPSNQVIIGSQGQQGIAVSADDGLVVDEAFRLVPIGRGEELPPCNEVRRGSFIVREVEVDCGANTCHRDEIVVCLKNQGYNWAPLHGEELY